MVRSNSARSLPLVIALFLAACFGLGACGGSTEQQPPAPEADAAGDEHDAGGSSETGADVVDSGQPEPQMEASADARGPDADVVVGDADASPPMCSLPVAGTLSLPSSTVKGTLRGPSLNMRTSCTTDLGTQGPEAVYLLTLTERTGVILQTTASTNTVVAIRRVCDDPVTEVACNNDGPMPPNAYLRAILDPGTYFVLVDVYAFGIGGDYTLSLDTFTSPPNATCAGATPVGDGAMVMGDLTNAATPATPVMCSSSPPFIGNVLYYKATVPPGNKLVANVKSSMGQPFVVDVLESCSASSCAAGGFGHVAYTNDKTVAHDVILVVSSGAPPPPPGGPPVPMGAFELDVSIQALAPNATCAAATAVTSGTTVMGDTSFGGADAMTPCVGGPFGPMISGPLWFSVTVPAGQILRVNVTNIDSFTPVLGALDGCGANATCLTMMNQPAPPPGGQLRYANGGATAQNVLFFVGHAPFDSGGRFSMTVSSDPLAANGNCATPKPLTDGVAVTGDTTLGATGTMPCSGPAMGMLYYSITVPANTTLGVELTPSTQWDAHVAILDSCVASSCLGSTDFGPMPTATFTNTSGSPRPVIVVVAGGYSGGAFGLTAALRTPPANVTCAAATPVQNGTSLTFQDATAASDNLSSRCNPSDTGGVLYYSATIGVGQTLKATASTTGRWLPSVRLLSSCGAATCLASSSPMPMPLPGTTLTYANPGSSPMDVILAVGPSAMFGPSGYFDLSVAIAAP
jgi:hypothetical protein